MTLHIQPFIFDGTPRGASSLKLTAKRYTMDDTVGNIHGLTLLFTHCIGAHKEQWEPTISWLLRARQLKDRIREAWSFDWQNHGDAGVLNRDALAKRSEGDGVSIYEWAPAIAAFVRSPMMKGHHIVALGHSAGAGAMVLTTKDMPLSCIPYAAIVLIEPTIVTRELFNAHLDDRMASMNFAVSATSVRRDMWSSREVAFDWLRKRYPWSAWDPRVVHILVEHGIYETSGGVTLKCDKKQEAASYPDVEGHFESAILLGRICKAVPIHVIWGDANDLVPEFIQDSLCDFSEGRIVASVSKVKGVGHMIVQERPNELAKSICDILATIQLRQISPKL